MHSLIGNSTSAKFIFFALDDVTSSVDEKKIKNLFDAKRINVYQRHGHYSSQLGPINDFFFLKRRGIFESKSYSDRGFTHVVRLDQNCEFEEVAYLILYGALPTKAQLADYKGQLSKLRDLPSEVKTILENLPKTAHPMDVVRTATSALASFYPEDEKHDSQSALLAANRLIAASPSALLYWY